MSDDAQSWVRPQRSWGKPQWGSLSNAGHQQWMGRLLQAPLCCLAGLKGARPECRVELGLPGSTISSQVSVLGHHRRDVGALGVESTCWESGDMDWVPGPLGFSQRGAEIHPGQSQTRLSKQAAPSVRVGLGALARSTQTSVRVVYQSVRAVPG
jgi:hypothetical protein